MCKSFKIEIILSGKPNFRRTCQSSDRGTLSKALTRSRKSTHVSRLCSLRFLRASLTENTASIHPLPCLNPHCAFWSRFSTNVCSQSCIIIANILAGPLLDLRDTLKQHLKESGVLVLSGILTEQVAMIIKSYTQCFDQQQLTTQEDWACLVFTNK